MNSNIKQKAIDHFNDFLKKDRDTSIDSDYIGVFQRAVDNPDTILTIDDEFNWDGSRCITHCDGRCCSLTDLIRITPIDMEYIMKSPMLEGKTRREVIEKYLEIFLGRDSWMPMGIIGKRRINEDDNDSVEFCPFMAGAMKIEVKGTPDNPEFENIGFGGICGLEQPYKPSICMLYPLGRIVIGGLNTDDKDTIFVLQQCQGSKTTKTIKIKDHITNYMERGNVYENYIKTMIEVVEKLKSGIEMETLTKTILKIFMVYLFVNEKDVIIKIKEIQEKTDEFLHLLNKYKKGENPKGLLDDLDKSFKFFEIDPI